VEQSVLVYQRMAKAPGEHVVVVCNYTPVTRHDYRIGVPRDAAYEVFFSSDDPRWGGNGLATPGPLVPTPGLWQNQPQSLSLTLPPLSVQYLRPCPPKTRAAARKPRPKEAP
jgi:1,4-alpha-glucan branching enzyme